MKLKMIIGALLFLMSLQSAFAGLHLKCVPRDYDGKEAQISDVTLFIVGMIETVCEDKDQNQYMLRFQGYGGGLEFTHSSLHVHCPFVSRQRILEGKPLKVGGPKLSVTVGAGGDLGVGANLRGAFCSFTGFNIGIGASVILGGYTIEHVPAKSDQAD